MIWILILILMTTKYFKYDSIRIAFWDDKSKGTQNMISLTKDKGLKIRVIKY